MATTDNCIPYDIRFVEELSPYLNLSKAKQKALKDFVELGLVQRDRLVETAIAAVSGHKIVSIQGQDFADGSDAKSVVSSARKSDIARGQWINSYKIHRVYTKTGPLRIVAYNQQRDLFHYFFIPLDAYAHLRYSVDILIERHTSFNEPPMFTGNINVYCKWWDYQCNSFEEMCLKT